MAMNPKLMRPKASAAAAPAASVPGAPTALSLADGGCTSSSNGRVSVSFTPPASDGGSVITHYRLRNTSSAVPFWEFTSAGGTSSRIVNVGSGWPGFFGNSIVRLSAVNAAGEGSFLEITAFPTNDIGQVCE
jgi:titin